MKKIFLTLIILLLLCGCMNKENNNKEKKVSKKKNNDVIETYKDSNETPIGIYNLQGNNLTRLSTINVTPAVEKEIGTFQIYLSNDENVILNKAFGLSYYDEWIKYNNIKLGFNIKFCLFL